MFIDIEDKKRVVSNVFKQTAAEAPQCVVDNQTGLVYMAYVSSPADRHKYGETFQEISLAVYNICAPVHAKHFSIELRPLQFSDNKNSEYKKLYGLSGVNVIDTGTKVRIFYYVGIHKCDYYYREFDKVTEEIGPAVCCLFKASCAKSPVALDIANLYDAYAAGHPSFIAHELAMDTKMCLYNGAAYTTLSMEKGYPMVVKTTDFGNTWEKVGEVKASFDGVLPEYENPMAICNGVFYCFMRCGNNDSGNPHTMRDLLWYSTDEGKTWRSSGLAFDTGMTKPDLFVYDGNLHTAYSYYINERMTYARAWRCNVNIERITNANGVFSKEPTANYFSEYGMVEFNVVPYHKKLVMQFSSGDLFLHLTDHYFYGKSQAKDLIYHVDITPRGTHRL